MNDYRERSQEALRALLPACTALRSGEARGASRGEGTGGGPKAGGSRIRSCRGRRRAQAEAQRWARGGGRVGRKGRPSRRLTGQAVGTVFTLYACLSLFRRHDSKFFPWSAWKADPREDSRVRVVQSPDSPAPGILSWPCLPTPTAHQASLCHLSGRQEGPGYRLPLSVLTPHSQHFLALGPKARDLCSGFLPVKGREERARMTGWPEESG